MESRHFAFNVARPLFANGDDKQSSVDLSTAVQHGHHRQDSKRNHRESELISFFLRAVEQKGGAAGLGQENWRARSRDNFTWQTQAISLRAHDMPPLWSTKFYICFVFGYLFVQKKSYPGRDKKQSKSMRWKPFVACELSSRGQKVRSQRHIYICLFFQAAQFTLRLNFSPESNNFLRAFMRHTLPVTFPGPNKQEKNIRFQEGKYKYQVEGWAMQHSSRVRDIFPT